MSRINCIYAVYNKSGVSRILVERWGEDGTVISRYFVVLCMHTAQLWLGNLGVSINNLAGVEGTPAPVPIAGDATCVCALGQTNTVSMLGGLAAHPESKVRQVLPRDSILPANRCCSNASGIATL